jgi:hypothetical protein
MTRIIGGIVQHIDRQRRELRIGGETLRLFPGMTVTPDVDAGTPVTALVREREGERQVIKLTPSSAPRFSAPVV